MSGRIDFAAGTRLTADDPGLARLSQLAVEELGVARGSAPPPGSRPSDAAAVPGTGSGPLGAAELVVDLSGVVQIDSSGVDALVALASACERSGVELRLAGANRSLRTVFEIARLHRRIAIDDDVVPVGSP